MKIATPLALALALAACQPAYEDAATGPAIGSGSEISGLEEREPDTCGAAEYQTAVGQPASVISGLGITGVTRTVRPGDIVTQEYNPARINFYLDGNDAIARVSCG